MKKVLVVFAILIAVNVAIGFAAYSYVDYYYQSAPVNKLKTCFKTQLFQVYLCRESENYAPLEEISQNLINAILVSEDIGFFNHNGFDVYEIRESFIKNLKKLRFARGGSTITQQLAKNVFLGNEKTLSRKLNEAIITYKLEQTYKKEFLIEKYLNVIQFGDDIFGIHQASNFYFNKPPLFLNLAESAFLAMLLPNPIKYSQSFRDHQLSEFADDRIQDILFKMKFYNFIEESQYNTAMEQKNLLFSHARPLEKPRDLYPSEDTFESEQSNLEQMETPLQNF